MTPLLDFRVTVENTNSHATESTALTENAQWYSRRSKYESNEELIVEQVGQENTIRGLVNVNLSNCFCAFT